ncbi:carboxylic ester hydrolase [Salmonella enterica subsp. enterica serovar Choleraesuis]|nr:carboxylic ester hydrolase [Salmonella enterica subsp. enterica serovar Choleraesuis]
MNNPSTIHITLPDGELIGLREDALAIWRGIPYAAPPLGELRWRAPQPVERWEGVREAFDNGSACWQDEVACSEMGGGSPGSLSEDCLWLNVFAPAESSEPLPVMVWLHGGGYTIGSAGLPPYDGRALARRGVVLVSVNYRLGHFGFFSHPALDDEEQEGPVANFALLDQIAALRWVQQNIHLFGGDAGRVTLFGESAGARSVLSLMASPLAKGLFHQAAVQSAYTLDDVPLSKARTRSQTLINALLPHDNDAPPLTAAELRAIPAQDIAQASVACSTGPVPIAGDRVLPVPMLETFFATRQHRMPVLIGSNSDEASVMAWFGMDLAEQIQRLRREQRLGLALIRLLYPRVRGDAQLGRVVCRDMAFTTLGLVVMQAQQRAGQPCWRYYFDYVSESGRSQFPDGAWHGNDIPYVFDNLDLAPVVMGRDFDDQDRAFAALVADYWVSFARSAGSHTQSLPGPMAWPACSGKHSRTLGLGVGSRYRLRLWRGFMQLRLQFFKRVMRHHVTLD